MRPQLGTTCRRCDLPFRIACRPHGPSALRTPHGSRALRTQHGPSALSVVRLFEDDYVGDALSGASCGFSTLNPYGGWESLFNRMAWFRRGAARRHNINQTACTDATRCVRTFLIARRTLHPQQNTENLYFGDKDGGTPLIVT